MDHDAPLPHSQFHSDDIPPSDRFDVWRDSVSTISRPYLAPGVDPKQCVFQTDAFLLEQVVFLRICYAGVSGFEHPGSSPKLDSPDLLTIHYMRSGGVSGANGAQTFNAGAGDIVILDNTRPISVVVKDSEALSCMIPRTQFIDLFGERSIPLQPVISGRSLAGQVLGQTIVSMWRRVPEITFADVGTARGFLLGAIAGTISGINRVTESAMERAALGAICAYIERNLADPDLGPYQLCKQFNCSRATLYRMFDSLGGISNYIRKLRLQRCYGALRRASGKAKITEVAMEWGFGNLSHFTRLFRATYGCAPSEVRESSAEAAFTTTPSRSSHLWAPHYQQWLESL